MPKSPGKESVVARTHGGAFVAVACDAQLGRSPSVETCGPHKEHHAADWCVEACLAAVKVGLVSYKPPDQNKVRLAIRHLHKSQRSHVSAHDCGVVAIRPRGHAVHSNSKSKPSTGFGGTLPRAFRWLSWLQRSVCRCDAALWISLPTVMSLQYLVHFDASSTSLEVLTEKIQTAGGHVSSYIPEDTLLVVAQASLLSQLQAQSGVAWIGDYLPKYKIAPEAQLLNGFLKSDYAALLLQQSVNHSAAISNAQMHNFIRQAPDGTSYIPLDVSFPHHLPDMLGQLQVALELCNTSNTTTQDCSHQAALQQLGSFYPSHAATVDWQVALDRICDSQCSSAASGAERLMVNAPVQHLQVHPLLLSPPLHLHVSTKTDSLLIQDLRGFHRTVTAAAARGRALVTLLDKSKQHDTNMKGGHTKASHVCKLGCNTAVPIVPAVPKGNSRAHPGNPAETHILLPDTALDTGLSCIFTAASRAFR